MSKYSVEMKLKVVEYANKHSKHEAARKFGMHKGSIQTWVSAYKNYGLNGLSTKNVTYTGDFKLSVIEYICSTGSSARQTAAHFNIPSFSLVCKWERTFLEEGSEAMYRDNRGRPRKIDNGKTEKSKLDKHAEEDLIAEVQRLRMENEYLKKSNALVQERIAREHGKKLPSSVN